MSDRTFNVAIIGAGGISRTHAEGFNSVSDAKIVAVAEPREDRRTAFAQKNDVALAVADYRELLPNPDIDAFVLCVPNYLHSVIAIDAMKAGKHVLTEKPMAANIAGAQEMVKVQKETGKTLMVSLQRRFEAITQLAKRYAGDVGELYYGRCGWFRREGIPGWGSWFTRQEESGGGPVNDIGVHLLDLCLYLMGYPEPVSVSAATYSKFGPKKQGLGGWGYPEWDGYFDVEDLASMYIHFANGATVVCEVSWAANTRQREWVEVMGTEGGITLGEQFAVYKNDTHGSPVDLSPIPRPVNQRIAITKHFIECCRTGKEPLTSPKNGLILNKIFDAAYRSASAGGTQMETVR